MESKSGKLFSRRAGGLGGHRRERFGGGEEDVVAPAGAPANTAACPRPRPRTRCSPAPGGVSYPDAPDRRPLATAATLPFVHRTACSNVHSRLARGIAEGHYHGSVVDGCHGAHDVLVERPGAGAHLASPASTCRLSPRSMTFADRVGRARRAQRHLVRRQVLPRRAHQVLGSMK